MLHHLYIADEPPTPDDPSQWDTNLSTEQVLERVGDAIRANQPDERLTIIVASRR